MITICTVQNVARVATAIWLVEIRCTVPIVQPAKHTTARIDGLIGPPSLYEPWTSRADARRKTHDHESYRPPADARRVLLWHEGADGPAAGLRRIPGPPLEQDHPRA